MSAIGRKPQENQSKTRSYPPEGRQHMRAQFAAAPPGLTEQIVPQNLGLTPQAIYCRRSAASKSGT